MSNLKNIVSFGTPSVEFSAMCLERLSYVEQEVIQFGSCGVHVIN